MEDKGLQELQEILELQIVVVVQVAEVECAV
jgi:hypothetical protein